MKGLTYSQGRHTVSIGNYDFLARKPFGYPNKRHDCEIFYSAEIEKYRNLYNDVRSKFTILCGDYEHLKLEHKDEMGKSIVKFLCQYR